MMRRPVLLATAAVIIAGGGASVLAAQQADAGTDARSAEAAGLPAASRGPIPADQRRAYFGDLHLHTTMSLDAWTFGSRVTPDQAYRFAREKKSWFRPARWSQSTGLKPPSPCRPGEPGPWTSWRSPITRNTWAASPSWRRQAAPFNVRHWPEVQGGRSRWLHRPDHDAGEAETAKALAAASKASDGWNLEMRAANANYRPGKFTTFIGYEWSASPGQGIHMHRNVIFSGDSAPTPFSANDSNRPEDLWKYLESVRAKGGDVLAIPHNSNFSDGRDFDWNNSDGQPIDAAYARARAVNEPLVEIAQTKGTSETTPELSPEDEFAGFENMDRLYKGQTVPTQNGSYVRNALGRGLVIQARAGANPFKFGLIGGLRCAQRPVGQRRKGLRVRGGDPRSPHHAAHWRQCEEGPGHGGAADPAPHWPEGE